MEECDRLSRTVDNYHSMLFNFPKELILDEGVVTDQFSYNAGLPVLLYQLDCSLQHVEEFGLAFVWYGVRISHSTLTTLIGGLTLLFFVTVAICVNTTSD